jgi:plastocyanin
MNATYRRTATWVIGLTALAAVAAACGGGSNAASTTPPPTTTTPPTTSAPSPSETESATPSATESASGTISVGSDTANNHGSKNVSGASTAEIGLGDFFFNPTVITGKPGQKITFELKNEGSALHNFSLTAQSIDKDVQPGQTEDITVTLPKSGFLEFFCKYHKALGMLGELKVP